MNRTIVDAIEGRIEPRVIFEVPVRHGKSELCDNSTPTWFLERYPDKQVILSTYEATFASLWGMRVRDNFQNNPDTLTTRVKADRSSQSDWMTTQGGGMKTAGVGGPIMGRGGHLMLVDDPYKSAEEAYSPTIRRRIWDWYDMTFSQRAEPGAVIIVLMARWHPEDLTGRLIAEAAEPWTVVTLRAEAEDADDQMGRKPGEPLWPARFDAEALAKRKKRPRSWAAQWQQRPRKASGGFFKRGWFPIVQDYPRDAKIVRYWDLAGTEPSAKNPDPDWAVGLKIAMKDGMYWIVDVVRVRESPRVLEQTILQTAILDGRSTNVWIEQEPGSSGKDRVSHYQTNVLPGFAVYGDPVGKSKEWRATPVASAAEAGNIALVEGNWNEAWLQEMEDFPTGDHDDQVDGTSGGVQAVNSDEDDEVDIW